MKEKNLTPEEIAKLASEKYFNEHSHEFTNENFGINLGIQTKEQLAQHFKHTLHDPQTLGIRAANGRNLYYNRQTNTFISQNNKEPLACTCFRPRKMAQYFFEKARHEIVDRRGLSKNNWKDHIKQGGHKAIEKEMIKEQFIAQARETQRNNREHGRSH